MRSLLVATVVGMLLLSCSYSGAMISWQGADCIASIRAWAVDDTGQHLGDYNASKSSQALSGKIFDTGEPPVRCASINIFVSITVTSWTSHGYTQAYRLTITLRDEEEGEVLDDTILLTSQLGNATYTFSAANLQYLNAPTGTRLYNWVDILVEGIECGDDAERSRASVFTEAGYLRPVNLTLTPSTLDEIDEVCTAELTHDPTQWQSQSIFYIWPVELDLNVSRSYATGPGTLEDPYTWDMTYIMKVDEEITRDVQGVVSDQAGTSKDREPLTLVPIE